jgi:hypothetical protein
MSQGLAPCHRLGYYGSVMFEERAMLGFFESVLVELLSIGPEFFLLAGAPELPRHRRLLTVRQGRQVALVEA